MSSSSTSLHATIHDLDALDRATLAKAHGNQVAKRPGGFNDRARRLAAARESSAGRVPPGSVADARRRHAAEVDSERAEAVANVKRARACLNAGKTNVAAMFYKVAAGHASGALRRQIEQEAAQAGAGQASHVARFDGQTRSPRGPTTRP